MSNYPPIIVVAYNRPKSLQRLLNSLNIVNYPNDYIKLIISIDRGESNDDVYQIAQDFKWSNGEKIINYQKENLGLRKHIVKCASYSINFGSVIILEDDLFVSPTFYNYACKALNFSEDKNYISGISLYNHQFNVSAFKNFCAVEDGYDNYYLQFASSWGQAWTKNQWLNFSKWYKKNQILSYNSNVPKFVTSWSEKSWLKYFIHYMVEKNKYFLYPKTSLTTNFSEAGTHIKRDNSTFQVPLNLSKKNEYQFSELKQSNSCYDSYFENLNLYKILGYDKKDLCVDLYGLKPVDKIKERYLLSSNIYNYKVIKSFGKFLKPVEANIIFNIEGKTLFLYDKKTMVKNDHKKIKINEILYEVKYITNHNILILLIEMIKNWVTKKIK